MRHRLKTLLQPDVVARACNPSTVEAKEEGLSQVQGQSGLHSGLQTSLLYSVRSSLKHKIKQNQKVTSLSKTYEC